MRSLREEPGRSGQRAATQFGRANDFGGSVRQRRVFAVPHGGSIKLAFRRNLSKPQPVAMCGQLVPGACQCFVRLC